MVKNFIESLTPIATPEIQQVSLLSHSISDQDLEESKEPAQLEHSPMPEMVSALSEVQSILDDPNLIMHAADRRARAEDFFPSVLGHSNDFFLC